MNKPTPSCSPAVIQWALLLASAGTIFGQYTVSTLASSSAAGTVLNGLGVAVDSSGNVYATGTMPGGNGLGAFPVILKINNSGISAVVGSAQANSPFPGCNMPPTSIGMTDLGGVAVDSEGNIYVAQLGNGPILRVGGGTVTCLLGEQYFGALGIVADNSGNVFFSTDTGGSFVDEGTSSSTLVTIAGNGTTGCTGPEIGKPLGVALDSAGNVYIADQWCNVVWKVTASARIPVAGIPGNANTGFTGDGGPATSALLGAPSGVAVDSSGNIYIADTSNARIRKVTAGIITTIAGNGMSGYSGDGGPATSAALDAPYSVAVGPGGKIYIGQAGDIGDGGDRIRVLTPVLPSFSITKAHTGSFVLGQMGATYTLTVSNAGAAPSSGLVTVIETLPAGLAFVSMAGTGWTCTGANCTRSDSLAGGASYPVITVTVNVAANALSPQVNQANVSGGGSASAMTSDPTTIVNPTPVTLNPSTLTFGYSGQQITSPQTVSLTFNPPAAVAWTASSNQPNIAVSPASGVGSAQLQISAAAGASGMITVTAPGATNSPQQIQVNVTSVAVGLPYGSFDTPANNTTGIAGAVPVTGWALDAIQATNVGIWREPVVGETAQSNGLVFIGTAVFVAGARPDVQATYPNAPFNYRGGWGYMLLTNFLPNASGSGASGNGTYKLHAIITNASGQTLDLGAHAITVDNVHASKPFGTIDTPAQGGTAAGNAYVNFGWALTQNPYVIPTDGSTINVIVDGVAVGHPVYNNYRSDIASLFPGLANSNGAIGFFYLDTTTLANGVHTISWNVFDNAGRGDGIGSRYFTVANTGTVAAPAVTEEPVAVPTNDSVTARIGFRQRDALPRASDGAYVVDMEELDRVELRIAATEAHLLVAGQRLSLPIGSTLRGGVFYWQAGPGFLGEYELVFERQGATPVHVRVVIRPKSYGERDIRR